MLRILWNSRSGMMAQQEKLDSISNNIANVNTEGYKKVDVSFRDLVYENLERTGYPNSNDPNYPSQNGTGVRASDWIRDNKQGALNQTGVNTDLAIDGEGFFAVTTPNGSTAYTRNGSFNVDANGDVVDKNGNRLNIQFDANLQPGDNKFSSDNFIVGQNGDVSKKIGDSFKHVGKINLYNFIGQNALNSVGQNLYVPSQGAQMYNASDFDIHQGFLEASNVDIASEMTDMIVTQRAFEFNAKGLSTADDMWGIANNLRAK